MKTAARGATGKKPTDLTGLVLATKLLRTDCVGNVTYVGYADAGTLDGATVWAIQRITETGGDATIEWADGNKTFDNVWDDRLTLTYS